MGRKTQARKSFLRSLLHDRAANTLAISAAAMFPILAMVGGGVDASRYYMAASRLQAACDAGALAARRAMITDDFEEQHRQIGLAFFDQNYDDGIFGSTGRTRNYTSDGEGRVNGTATTTMPATIMRIFGFNEIELEANCSAEINISNTDIMFVLDVTGSMNCPDNNIAGCTNGNNNEVEVGNSLIVGLRNAVMSFYDTVEDATSDAAQVRYGLLPYAHNVNVGFDLPRQYLADSHTYQSRVARFQLVNEWQTVSDQVEWLPRLNGNFGSSNQDDYRWANNNNNPSLRNDTEYNRCENFGNDRTVTLGNRRYRILSDEYVLNVWSGGPTNLRAGCRGRVITQEQVQVNRFRDYVYCPVTTGVANNCGVNNPAGSPVGWEAVDLSTLYDDNEIDMPVGNQGAMQTVTWNGCIEEAQTVSVANWNPTPSGAFDLNINLRPANNAEQWKPMLHSAVYQRQNGSFTLGGIVVGNANTTANLPQSAAAYCVSRARRLSEISRGDLQTYVNSLRARGATYHDIGMIWGARYISPRGIFRDDNDTAPNGDAIARHIVFMTDGSLAPNPWVYSPYGMEPWDRRVRNGALTDFEQRPDGTSVFSDRHEARFQAACRAARNENITVWVVAFGTALTPSLENCASPGRAFQASNNAQLNSAFQEIAQRIAALRLTQ